nr:hypothetical protein [Micromonospora sp. DSM 115978]
MSTSPHPADLTDDLPPVDTTTDAQPDDETGAPGDGALVCLERAEGRPVVDHELTISPGAGPHDVAAHLMNVPADASLVDMYGDVDLTVVFREPHLAA